MPHRRLSLVLLTFAAFSLSSSLPAQIIVQSRGVDSRVSYASLVDFGPWDDRNYELTQEDLELLAENEAELSEAIPAFYRVQLRRARPEMLRTGPVQYPRSGLPLFRLEHGGYLIDGRIYTRLMRRDDRVVVDLKDGKDAGEFFEALALAGEVRVTSPEGAAESAIAFHPSNTQLVIAGSNGPGGGQKMHYSTDGGASWNAAGALPLGGTCCDPTMEWSSDGSKAYTATLGSAVFFYRSADGGQTWTDLNTEPGNDPRRELGGGVDKEYLHVDHFPTSPYLDNIYMTWHESTTMKFGVSSDFGHTWSLSTISSGSSESGIGSDLTSDKSGNVYYIWPGFNARKIWVRKSSDGGATFDPTVEVASTNAAFDWPLPSMDTRFAWIYVAAGADLSDGPFANSLYAAWTDTSAADTGNPNSNHARIQVAYSRDGGATWSLSTPHETVDIDSVDRWNQWLAVGPDGSVHVVFYDTRQDLPGRQDVDLYYSYSTDGAVSWSSPERLTSVTSPNIGDGFEFGDYNGLDVVLGDLIAIFTDNRQEGGGGGDSVDVYAVGKTLSNPEIFADGFETGDTSSWSP